MMSALSVAASAPPDVEVSIVDENVEPVDFDADADVVGLSFMTFNAPRAYEIARRFRERGRTVLFGGYHPTLVPEEAAAHCDALCIGPAEPNLPLMLEDWRAGRLKPVYRRPLAEFRTRPIDARLVHGRQYIASTVVQATRGCHNHCEFCSVAAFSDHVLYRKPIDDVVREIRAGRGRSVLFIDDSLSADPAHFRELLRAIVPLRIRWYSQIGFGVTRDAETLDLMERSGCRGVFVGFESISQRSLDETRKSFNRADEYREGIRRLHEHGIGVFAAFVLGYDSDGPDVFERTLRFLDEAEVDALQLTVLTPFPGTPLHRKMEQQGRLLDRNWEHYDLGHVVFEPAGMTAAALQAGHDEILATFYSWPWILRRLRRQVRYLRLPQLGLSALVGWGYRLKTRLDGYVQ
jgi:radical SAM superfamily enzyme YgiQ (UPF0313 family)